MYLSLAAIGAFLLDDTIRTRSCFISAFEMIDNYLCSFPTIICVVTDYEYSVATPIYPMGVVRCD